MDILKLLLLHYYKLTIVRLGYLHLYKTLPLCDPLASSVTDRLPVQWKY